MITEVLGLAGSGAAGALFGMVSDSMASKREFNLKKLDIEMERERSRNENVRSHFQTEKGFTTSPAYSVAFLCLTFSYCACALICFIWPNVELVTFNPGSEPKDINILFGLFKYTLDPTKVYTITTGGVGFSLLHPLAFQIGTVITGITPTRRA